MVPANRDHDSPRRGQATNDAAPRITVLIPTYRRPELLARALSSVLEQDGPRRKVCVFDNCSMDDTAGVVNGFARRFPDVHYHCQPENIGSLRNFEFALRSVTSEYFSLLSDDDYLLPGFFQRSLGGLQMTPDAAFWAGATLMVDSSATIVDARVLRWPESGRFDPPEGAIAMTGGMAPIWTGILFRSHVLQTLGLPRFELGGPSDLDFVLRIAASRPVVVEKVPVAVFTLNESSYSATEPLSSFWPGWRTMIARFREDSALPGAGRRRLAELLDRDAERMLFRRGINALAHGRVAFASEAAGHLRTQYGSRGKAALVQAMVAGCRFIPGTQALLRVAYRLAERRIIRSRKDLTQDYLSLLRRP